MRPDFSKIGFKPSVAHTSSPSPDGEEWLSPEHIAIKPRYSRGDLAGLEHLEYAAGIPPTCAGPTAPCT